MAWHIFIMELFRSVGLGFFLWLAILNSCSAAVACRYTLLEGSLLVDDCPVCDRMPIVKQLRGTFDLVLENLGAEFTDYRIQNVEFVVGGGEFLVNGAGAYRIGGYKNLIQQDLQLSLIIDQQTACFTNQTPTAFRKWPTIEASVTQTNGTMIKQYSLTILAAPVRELWFSTRTGLTPGLSPGNHVSGGDLISFNGRVVKNSQDLTRNLGLKASATDPGLAALDVGSSGQVFFSLSEGGASSTLGNIQQGDLVSSAGKIHRTNQDLTRQLGMQPPVPDLGLDAVQVLPSGEIYFSIRNSAFSERLGQSIQKGDILSDRGVIIQSNQALLANFHPKDPRQDYGLDALYIWPEGEIWFSTEESFESSTLGMVTHGDLLSNQGFIVFRNLEMVGAFQPLEDIANFGLDAVYVVTDMAKALDRPPVLAGIQMAPGGNSVQISWQGPGEVFQVESSATLNGPFTARSVITLDQSYEESFSRANAPAFYRVRQW